VRIAAERDGLLAADPEAVAAGYRAGELDQLDVIRQHGVILDWGSGELLPTTTAQFRAMLARRTAPFWRDGLPTGARR
jgi:N-methylhydantoinase B